MSDKNLLQEEGRKMTFRELHYAIYGKKKSGVFQESLEDDDDYIDYDDADCCCD